MTRFILAQTGKYRIFVHVYRKKITAQIIDYTHVLGSVSKSIYEEKSVDRFNYVTKDHKEQVQKNREFLEKFKTRGVKNVDLS